MQADISLGGEPGAD